MTSLSSNIINLYVRIPVPGLHWHFSDSQKKKLPLLLILLLLLLFKNEQKIHTLKLTCSLTLEVETGRHLYFNRLLCIADHSQLGPEACTFFSSVSPNIISFKRNKKTYIYFWKMKLLLQFWKRKNTSNLGGSSSIKYIESNWWVYKAAAKENVQD